MKLRGYQSDALDGNDEFPGIFPAWEAGNRAVLLLMPTGTGKTVVFAHVVNRVVNGECEFLGGAKRVMILAHRQELIWQAKKTVEAIVGVPVDVEMGDERARVEQGDMFKLTAQVIVSTIQTQTAGGDGSGRLGKFDPGDFDVLIIDEAHRAVSPSYRRTVDYYLTNPKLFVLGVTATWNRSDEEALGQVFDAVALNYDLSDAIEDGYLCPIDVDAVSVESIDFTHINTTSGDLNQSDLDAVMTAEKNSQGVAGATIQMIGDEAGIGFASSVNHARILTNIFNRPGGCPGGCAFIHGGTEKEERRLTVSDFSAGKIQFIWNYGVLTEGFDAPWVRWIAMARPTKSLLLYTQMLGRGTRPAAEIANALTESPAAVLRRMMIARSKKPTCRIIDFIGNDGKHKIVRAANVLGGNYSAEAVDAVTKLALASKKPVRVTAQLKIEEERLEEERRKADERRLQEEARKHKLVAKVKFTTKKVDPFDILAVRPVRTSSTGDGKTLSEKGRNWLRSQGYDPDRMDYARAVQLIRTFMSRYKTGKSTPEQIRVLKSVGFSDIEAKGLTKEQASKCIDAAKQNGWKKPFNFEIPKADEPTKSGDPF